jgi:hypothetical protein
MSEIKIFCYFTESAAVCRRHKKSSSLFSAPEMRFHVVVSRGILNTVTTECDIISLQLYAWKWTSGMWKPDFENEVPWL